MSVSVWPGHWTAESWLMAVFMAAAAGATIGEIWAAVAEDGRAWI